MSCDNIRRTNLFPNATDNNFNYILSDCYMLLPHPCLGAQIFDLFNSTTHSTQTPNKSENVHSPENKNQKALVELIYGNTLLAMLGNSLSPLLPVHMLLRKK